MTADRDALTARLRTCWIRKDNLRLSSLHPWSSPCWRAVVVESVHVAEQTRRQGVFKRFLAELCQTPDIDLFVVEGVANPLLAAALLRWGWDVDPGVMDFYYFAATGRPATT